MSYQEHENGNANEDGIVVSEHEHGSSQENHQRGNEDERNRQSHGSTTIVGDLNRQTSDQWAWYLSSTTVEIWNLINKTSPDEACIHTLYCPWRWFPRFLSFTKDEDERLVRCNTSIGSEVSQETQRHTTRAPSDTRRAPVDFNFDTIIVAQRVLALDSHIQIEHWNRIRNLCVLIEGANRHELCSPGVINRLSQLSLFENILKICIGWVIPGLEYVGDFTISTIENQRAADLYLARALEEQLAMHQQASIQHVEVVYVRQDGLKWYHFSTL
ncbi:042fcfdb-e1f4-4acc-bdfe-a6173cc2ac87 [Sclerotinia trifoliorum]|uniref:042fcfdb-e1f4-4acc-bdfe-a6173cc2ac87 n=1 Tax=Sclerotinia trifoliorum TaxID=28548 RepID=A0A8H2VXX7_9HELO|nr:042fcfdb-e1f4-4acc-bdfe-a6173cc2ac87 [Sclerotinia trifoliorum]